MAVAEVERSEPGHVRGALEQGLRDAERHTLGEIDLVISLLDEACEAALAESPPPALPSPHLAEEASEAHARYGEVHDCLLALIARQAPVACDLRLAIALLHVNDRVERIAAQCMNLLTLRAAMSPAARLPRGQRECVARMAELAGEQLAAARDAFAQRDSEQVRRVRERDREINAGNRRCFALAVRLQGGEADREAAFFLALMARAIERIGDNAVDVAQQAEFVVSARLRPPSRTGSRALATAR